MYHLLTSPEKEKQKIKKSWNKNYKNKSCYIKKMLKEKIYAPTALENCKDLL